MNRRWTNKNLNRPPGFLSLTESELAFFFEIWAKVKCFRFIVKVSVFRSNCSQSLTRFRWPSLYWMQFVTCFFVLNSLSHQTKPEPEETKLKIYKTSTPASTYGQLELVSPTTHKAPPRMTCTDGNFYDYWLLAFRKVCETPPKIFRLHTLDYIIVFEISCISSPELFSYFCTNLWCT